MPHNGGMHAARQDVDRHRRGSDAERRRPWRRAGVAAFACALALTALGCGGGEDAAAPPASGVSTAAATDAAAAAATAAVPDLRGVAVDVRRDPG